ncbi:MAG: hypothetical protein ACXVL8_18870, partial [Acidimicrobiia bacterium]
MVRTRAVVVAILAAASLGGWWLGHTDRGVSTNAAFVVKAVDGDTIDVRIGSHTDIIRRLGIDTPERARDYQGDEAARVGMRCSRGGHDHRHDVDHRITD